MMNPIFIMSDIQYRKNYCPPAFSVEKIDLLFDIREEKVVVTATSVIVPQVPNATCVLDGTAHVVGIALNGDLLTYDDFFIENNQLHIKNTPNQTFTLCIQTEVFPHKNKTLSGLYASGSGLFTQCEAEGFRNITYFFDRPDVLTRYFVRIEADQKTYPVLLSNGNLKDSGSLKDGRHFVEWEDPFAKPSYLFALVAGDLARSEDSFITMSGRNVAIHFYTNAEDQHKTAFAIESLKNAMRWDEERFGLEYDLDLYMVVAVSDFNMGAMENKGLNIFNTKYVLADEHSATDTDFENIENVIGHEYFHNYTGNRVTCRDWFQLSLKEGLTVFRDQEFSGDRASRAVRRIGQVKLLRSAQFAEDASPTAHPVRPDSYEEINNFYTVTVYDKGAEVVRLYQTMFGEAGFKAGLRLYLSRFDGQAATCDDFMNAMAEANHADLTQFSRWYSQAGTPVVNVSGSLNTLTNTYTLTIQQFVPETAAKTMRMPMLIPIKFRLLDHHGNSVPLRQDAKSDESVLETVLMLTKNEQHFVFYDIHTPVIPSLLRGFSAPVRLNFAYSDEELNIIMRHDDDAFTRWEAAQTLYRQAIVANLEALKAGSVLPNHAALLSNIRYILQNGTGDDALTALMLQVTEETALFNELAPIDPLLLFTARESLIDYIAQHCQQDFQVACEKLLADLPPQTQPYQPETAGLRALLNVYLSYLCQADDRAVEWIARHYKDWASDMTRELGMLRAINHSNNMLRLVLLNRFADCYANDALVLDKYFALLASSHAEGSLKTVQTALTHPAFSMENPNKVYSLIGAFTRNTPLFHASNGSGYHFVGDAIRKIDRYNPQLASRLTKSFSQLPLVDKNHQQLMRYELNLIAQNPHLSKDTKEIVHKILDIETA